MEDGLGACSKGAVIWVIDRQEELNKPQTTQDHGSEPLLSEGCSPRVSWGQVPTALKQLNALWGGLVPHTQISRGRNIFVIMRNKID